MGGCGGGREGRRKGGWSRVVLVKLTNHVSLLLLLVVVVVVVVTIYTTTATITSTSANITTIFATKTTTTTITTTTTTTTAIVGAATSTRVTQWTWNRGSCRATWCRHLAPPPSRHVRCPIPGEE